MTEPTEHETTAVDDSRPEPPPAERRGTAAAHAASRARRIGGRPSPSSEPAADRPRPSPKAASAPLDTDPAGPKAKSEQGPERRPKRRPKRRIAPAPAGSPRSARPRPPLRVWLPLVLLGAALVAAVAGDLSWLGGLEHPGGHQTTTSAADRQKLLAEAKTKVAKVASYDYRHIDQDAKDAEAGTTGEFTATYDKSIQTVIKPLAAQVKAIVSCNIQTAGITSVSGDGKQAVVLIYAQLSTQNSTTNGQSRLDIATIQATMTKRGSDWYISKLDRE